MASQALPVMNTFQLVRDHGVKTNRRCGCCGFVGIVWDVGGYFLCSWCDLENDRRWR